MAKVLKTTFKLKRGSAQAWKEQNPILAAGEPGYELDTHKLKIGDGSTHYNDLPYICKGTDADIELNIATTDQIKELFDKEDENNG